MRMKLSGAVQFANKNFVDRTISRSNYNFTLINAVQNHIWNMWYDMQLLDTYNYKSLLKITTYISALCYVDYPGVLCFFCSGLCTSKIWIQMAQWYYWSGFGIVSLKFFFFNFCPFFFVFIFYAMVLIFGLVWYILSSIVKFDYFGFLWHFWSQLIHNLLITIVLLLILMRFGSHSFCSLLTNFDLWPIIIN